MFAKKRLGTRANLSRFSAYGFYARALTQAKSAYATPQRPADSHEILALTGIRGISASLVVLFHFYNSWVLLLPSLQSCEPLALRGHLGVDLFFILSGFILAYVYSAGDFRPGISEYLRFLWFRIARIYPNHLITVIALALLVFIAQECGIAISGDYPLSGLPFQLTLTHAWPWLEGGKWNYPSWTISAEWFAYLCMFPAGWYLLRLRSLGGLWFLLIGYFVLALWLFVLPPLEHGGSLLQVSCEFIAGSMFFGVFTHLSSARNICRRYVSAIFVLITALLLFLPVDVPSASALVVLFFPLLLIGLTSETALLSKFLSSAPALWLGRVSYALYMSHALAQKIIKIVLPSEHYVDSSLTIRLLLLSVNILLVLLFAAALYYMVEIPSRNYLRRLTFSRSRVARV
jgi:peptidoglycan/LPS O-acetylase OafA/YrhL